MRIRGNASVLERSRRELDDERTPRGIVADRPEVAAGDALHFHGPFAWGACGFARGLGTRRAPAREPAGSVAGALRIRFVISASTRPIAASAARRGRSPCGNTSSG